MQLPPPPPDNQTRSHLSRAHQPTMKRKPDVPPTSGIQPSAKRTVIDLSGPQPNANFTPAATQRRRNMPTFTPNYSTPGLRSVQPNVSRATPANIPGQGVNLGIANATLPQMHRGVQNPMFPPGYGSMQPRATPQQNLNMMQSRLPVGISPQQYNAMGNVARTPAANGVSLFQRAMAPPTGLPMSYPGAGGLSRAPTGGAMSSFQQRIFNKTRPNNLALRKSLDQARNVKKSRPPKVAAASKQNFGIHGQKYRYIDLSKSFQKEEDILYGVVRGYIFGPERFQRHIHVGDEIRLERDFNNQADTNAVKVLKVVPGAQEFEVGQCDVMIRDAFGQLLCEKSIKVSGKIVNFDELIDEPPIGRFAAQMKLDVLGKPSVIDKVASRLNNIYKVKDVDLYWYQEHPAFKPITYEQQSALQNKTDLSASLDDIEEDFNQIFGSAMDQDLLEEVEPGEAMNAELLPYQKVGLNWMCGREQRNKGRSLFWKEKTSDKGYTYWQNDITGKKQARPPEEFRGGILADDMGLGKTIQMISLICSSDYLEGPTLIVAPLSVLDNWVTQMKQHTNRNALRVLVYHGSGRETNPDVLESYDVIVTTYNIISTEHRDHSKNIERRKEEIKNRVKDQDSDSESSDSCSSSDFDFTQGLHAVKWLRICLDEAHQIRSRKSKQFKAVCDLWAERRWCLTGTPVQNKIDDLYALIKFLQVAPLAESQVWHRIVLKPLKQRNPEGLERLRTAIKYICLRRTKEKKIEGKRIVNLPPKASRVVELEFSEQDQMIYNTLKEKGKKRFRSFMDHSSLQLVNYAHVLEILLRIRQFCDHPVLVPDSYMSGKSTVATEVQRLLTLLEDSQEEDCQMCWKIVSDPVVTPCAHLFHKRCLTSRLSTNNSKCPMCDEDVDSRKIVDASCVEEKKRRDEEQSRLQSIMRRRGGDIQPSAKIERLVHEIQNNPYDIDPHSINKNVVFSQWTSMLDIVQIFLRKAGINFVRLDGTMSRQQRYNSIHSFQEDPDVQVFLLSLKAGNLGLNLTSANRVFLLDPWWNPAAEDQAVDRVHRLGQLRPVEVIRLIMKDSVESRVVELQAKKRKLIKSAMGNISKEEMKSFMVQGMADLFR
eukprot:213153_1